MQQPFSVSAVLKESYSIIKPRFWTVIGQYALLAVIFIGLDLFASSNFLLALVLSSLFSFATVVFGFSYVEEGSFSFNNIYKRLTFKKFATYFLANLLADLAIFGGIILLVIPGIIVLVQIRLSKYIIIEEDVTPIEALKKSVRLTKGSRWKLLEFMVIMLLINAIGLIIVGVGLLFTVPLTLMAFIIVFKKLSGNALSVQATDVPLETA